MSPSHQWSGPTWTYCSPPPGFGAVPKAKSSVKMPIGVAMLPSWVSAAMPFAPIWAGIPTPIGCQPALVRCQTSIFADEPPTPTTEITCVALPTDWANHGASTAWPTGARASSSETNVAHSRTSSRRTHP